MSKVAIYLNFQGNAAEAFNFYKSVFKTDFSMPILRMRDLPSDPDAPKLSDAEMNGVMHVALPITGGTELMGTDLLESMGHTLIVGNNITISLQLDSKKEADTLYEALSNGGSQKAPMSDQFWGYWGTCVDQFNVSWMFNVLNDQYNKQ